MFCPYSYDDSHPDAFEYLPAAKNLTLEVGTALCFEGGMLVVALGANVPEYISMTKKTTTSDGDTVAVMRVAKDVVYETELAADNAALALGEKYTIDDSGTKITATTADGVAQVVAFDGTNAGCKVRVRF